MKYIIALVAALSVTTPATAAYFDKREIADGVTCHYYQTSQDEIDLHDLLIKTAYYEDYDVMLDKTDHDGYDRVLIVKAPEGFYASRWDRGLYCIQFTPLPKEKPL